MTDYTNVKSIIEKNRPTLSTFSVHAYISSLNTIAKALNLHLTIDSFVSKYKEIRNYLDTLKLNNRKSKIAAIVVLLDDSSKKHSEVLTEYRKKMMEDVK